MAQDRVESKSTPIRDAVRLTVIACMVGAVLAIALIWSGVAQGPLERALPIVAVMLCLWANVLSVLLLAGWLRR